MWPPHPFRASTCPGQIRRGCGNRNWPMSAAATHPAPKGRDNRPRVLPGYLGLRAALRRNQGGWRRESTAWRAPGASQGAKPSPWACWVAGIDVVYPRCNLSLYQDIERHGAACVTRFGPRGLRSRRGIFPGRKPHHPRALSLGKPVGRSGPAARRLVLITARLANSYGREVFAVPGSLPSHPPL